MSDDIDPEIAGLYSRLNATNKALVTAWVLIGRCDATLEALESPHVWAAGRRAIIRKMRAEIVRAMGAAQ